MTATTQIAKKTRQFYRCLDCLAVVATEEKLPLVRNLNGTSSLNAICNACGGKIEHMGETVRTVLSEFALRNLTGYKSICDGKCTGAHGPNCDCICGGENHGTGRIVPVYTESGVPRVMVPMDAVEKALEYRRLVDLFKTAYNARYGGLNAMKRNGEWISNFDAYLDGQYLWSAFLKAKTLKTHSGRNKRITDLTLEAGKRV